jgi:nucleoside-triphosphatase THEP1
MDVLAFCFSLAEPPMPHSTHKPRILLLTGTPGIGKMECLSQHFVSRMRALLESDKLIIATVTKHGSGLIQEAKQRPDSELWELTRANRDALAGDAMQWLGARARCGP